MINLNLNLALKTTKKISKLWDCKSKTILVGAVLIVSWRSCLGIAFKLKKYINKIKLYFNEKCYIMIKDYLLLDKYPYIENKIK